MSSKKMQTLINLIQETTIDEKYYVYFNKETGSVIQVGTEVDNLSEELYGVINVTEEEVSGIMSGTSRMDDYQVIYNPFDNKNLLYNLSKKQHKNFIDNLFYEVPQNTTNNEEKLDEIDFLITQNLKETVWMINISNRAIDFLFTQHINLKSYIELSLTSKHDPNILYTTITVNLKELVEDGCKTLPFHYDFENNGDDISIFVTKLFNNYLYKKVV